jgi:molybdopterin converting factor small subunit
LIRVVLPYHLRNLAGVENEVQLECESPTLAGVLDALEARYPQLRGTIRDRAKKERRPFLRFFACERDITHEPAGAALPDEVASGREPLIVLGAIAGGLC